MTTPTSIKHKALLRSRPTSPKFGGEGRPVLDIGWGFTLIEILVSISIISILTILVFSNYYSGRRQFALQRSAHKLTQDLRRAQEMAMSAKKSPLGNEPKTGYGVFFEENEKEYKLYADIDSNEFFTSENDEIVETIKLEKGVHIKEINSNSSPKKISVNFKPPDPTVKIKFLVGGANEAIITLSLVTDDSKTKTIKINKVGRIEIE